MPTIIANECTKCERLKKLLEEVKAECVNKDRRITTLETENGRPKTSSQTHRDGGERDDLFHRDDRDQGRDQERRSWDRHRAAVQPPPPEEAGGDRAKEK